MRPIHTFLAFTLAMALGVSAALADQLLGTPRWTTSQTTVLTAPILVAPSRPTRWSVRVAQAGATTVQVYCGPTNAVSAANGYPILPVVGSFITIDSTGEVWCISASSQVVAVMENY